MNALLRRWLDAKLADRIGLERMPRLRHRIDFVLVFLVVLGVTSLGAVGLLAGWILDARGAFVQQPFRAVPDARILHNLRDDPNAAPFADMAFDAERRTLLVLREDGRLHRLDLRTRVWREVVDAPADFAGPFSALQSGCGPAADPDRCPAPSAVWAITRSGALARLDGDGWRTLISDTRFVGLSGAAVSQDALTAVAVSDDGRWILLAAGTEGFGLFDAQSGTWQAVDPADQRALRRGQPPGGDTRLAFAGDRFWVGAEGGLSSFAPVGGGTDALAAVSGPVLDLDRAADGTLLVLSEEACEGPGAACLHLNRIRNGSVENILAEREHHPSLNGSAVFHAGAVPEGVVAVAADGVYLYLEGERHWRQLAAGTVVDAWEGTGTAGLYVVIGDSVLQFRDGRQVGSWSLAGFLVRHLLPVAGGAPLLVGQGGGVAALAPDGSLTEMFPVQASAIDPTSVHAGAAVGSTVLLAGRDGLLIHDVRRRTYVDQASPTERLISSPTRLVAAGRRLWAVDDDQGWAAAVDLGPSAQGPVTIADEILVGRGWTGVHPDGAGLLVTPPGAPPRHLQFGGQAIAATALWPDPAGRTDMISALVAGDVGPDGSLWLADRQRVQRYDTRARAWSMARVPDLDGQAIVDVAVHGDDLLVVGSQGLLVRNEDAVLGAGPGMPVASSRISDAVADGGLIFMAGDGQVAAYGTVARRVHQTWPIAGDRPLIKGVFNGMPLLHAGNVAQLGRQSLSVDNAEIVDVARSGEDIVTLQRLRGTQFVAVFGDNGARCVFRRPEPGGARLDDARSLDDGRRIAALLNGRLEIYDDRLRSWQIAGPDVPAAERLYRLADHLAVVGAGGLTVAPLDRIRVAQSCSTAPVRAPWGTLPAAHIAVDEASATAALLNAAGVVQRWRGGRIETVLPAPNGGPDLSRARRVYRDGSRLIFYAGRTLWIYDLDTRNWRAVEIRLGDPSDALADLDLRVEAGGWIVTGWTSAGRTLSAMVDPGDAAIDLDTPLVPLFLPAFPWAPARLVDVAEIDGDRWGVLLDDRLMILDAATGRWMGGLALPHADRRRSVRRWGDRLVVAEPRSGQPDRVYLVPQSPPGQSARPAEHVLEPATGARHLIGAGGEYLWAVGPDDAVLSCPFRPGASYPAACSRALGPALSLRAGDVEAAYQQPGWWLVRAAGAWTVIDRAARVARPVTGPLDGVTRPQTVFQENDRLYLLADDGRLLTVDADARSREVLAGVSALGRVAGELAARIGVQVVRLPDGVPSPPSDLIGWPVDAADIRTSSINADRTAAALLRDGTLLARRHYASAAASAAEADDLLSMPGAPALADPRAVFRLDRSDDRPAWLIQDRSALVLATPGQCPVDDPEADGSEEGPSQQEDAADEDAAVGTVADQEVPGEATAADTAPPPPPPMIDCVESRRLDLPAAPEGADRIVTAANLGGDVLTVRLSDGAAYRYRLDAPADGTSAFETSAAAWLPGSRLARLADRASVLRARIATAPDGVERLDLLRGEPGTDGWAVLRSDVAGLSFEGHQLDRASPQDALNAGWLRWDRTARTFEVAGAAGPVAMAPSQFIQAGRFIVSAPGIALRTGMQEMAVANRYGVWRYADLAPSATGQPAGQGPVFTPVDLPGLVAAAHGRFRLADGRNVDAAGVVAMDADSHREISGGLTVTETLRGGGLSFSLSRAGATVDPVGAQGFLWDQRSDIGLRDGDIVMVTPLGLVRPDSLSGIVPLPAGGPSSAFDVVNEDGLYARSSDQVWWRLTDAGWVRAADPTTDRSMVDTPQWHWHMRGGVAQIAPAAGAPDWRTQRDGMAFVADRILALGSDGGAVVLLTPNGTTLAADAGALHRAGMRVADLPPDTDLDSLRLSPTETVVVAGRRGGRTLWDGQRQAWVLPNPGRDPVVRRNPVDTPLMQIGIDGGASTVTTPVRRLDGTAAQARLTWSAGALLPIDHAQDVFVEGNRVMIATQAGLEIRTPAAATWRLDTRIDGQDQPRAIVRIGRPDPAPHRVLARTADGACYELTAATPQPCGDAALLDRLRLARTAFWHWVFARTPLGVYLDSQGSALPPPIDRVGGSAGPGLPHDRPTDAMRCDGRGYTAWGGSRISVHDGAFALGSARTFEMLSRDWQLLCVASAVPIGQTVVPAGAYAFSGASALAFDGTSWRSVPELAGSLARLQAGDLVYAAGRLRLVLDGARLLFEHNRLDGVWRPIDWIGGRWTIDAIEAGVWAYGTPWMATPAGLVRFARSQGRIEVDPAQLRIVPIGGADGCPIDRIETLDGETAAIPRQAGTPTRLRCRDGRVMAGILDGSRDADALAVQPADPFATRTLIDEEGWTWTANSPDPTRRGSMAVVLRDRSLRLTGGRFDADRLGAVAAVEPGWLELITDHGWLRNPETDIGLLDSRLGSVQPQGGVQAASRDVDRRGDPILCLSGRGGETVWRPDTDTARDDRCGTFAGLTGLWEGRLLADGVQFRGYTAEGAQALRRLEDGRFSDMIVRGLPAPVRSTAAGGTTLIVPTEIGATGLGDTGVVQAVFLVGQRPGDGLYRARDGTSSLVAGRALFDLNGLTSTACPALSEWLTRLPDDARVMQAMPVADGAFSVLVERGYRRDEAIGRCNARRLGVNLRALDVADRWYFNRGRTDWPSDTATVQVTWDQGGAYVHTPGGLMLTVGPGLRGAKGLRRSVNTGEAVFLLTGHEIYLAEADDLIHTVFTRGSAGRAGPGLDIIGGSARP